MIATAKIRTSDRQQTVQLPAGFELAATEVWVRKDEATGELILSPMPSDAHRPGLDTLFKLLDEAPLPDDFLSARANPIEASRNPLADWSE